jgi:type II secretory pathway predicted ATPase ExeA
LTQWIGVAPAPAVGKTKMDSSHATREQDPFGADADARYVYLNRNLENLLVALVSAITDGRERLLVTGGEGAGKSAFLWKLAEVLYTSGEFALLGQEMVFSCRRDMSLEAIETAVHEHAILRENGDENAPSAVLLLDDADRLDPTVLASLWQRWPTLNEGWRSMCVVMSALPQPKQLHRRRGHDVMAAEQTFELPPMDSADVEGLIWHRLHVAGLSGLELFSPDALERIGYFSKRVPGRIVQLCGHIFNNLGKDLSPPVSEDIVKEAAYDLFLPGHLQKLARGLAFQPKPSPYGVGNTGPQWNAGAFASNRGRNKHDADVPHDDASGGRIRQHGDRITMPATPPATTTGQAPQRMRRERQLRMGVRPLASAGAILLLVAAMVWAVGVMQNDRTTDSPLEAASTPSDSATISNDMVQAPDAGQDSNAANPLSTPDIEQARAPEPAASLPEVMPEAMGVAGSDQASPPAPADPAFGTVEPRRSPPRIEPNTIAVAQTQLNALGYTAGPVDGIVGSQTRAAIRRFQAATGLPVDGRMSDPLIAALRRQSTKSNLQTQGRVKPRRRIMPAILQQFDSVKAPEAFQEYCRENRDTWVYDQGKRRFVFCAHVLKQR